MFDNGDLALLKQGYPLTLTNSALINGSWEDVPLGVFYLKRWTVLKDGQLEIVADDIFNSIALNQKFQTSNLYNGKTVAYILNEIYPEAVATDGIKDVVVSGAILPDVTVREAIHQLAVSAGGYAKVGRDGKIYLIKEDASWGTSVDFDYGMREIPTDRVTTLYTSATVNQIHVNLPTIPFTPEQLFKGDVTAGQMVIIDKPFALYSISNYSGTYTTYLFGVKFDSAGQNVIINGLTADYTLEPVTAQITGEQDNNRIELNEINGLMMNTSQVINVAIWLLTVARRNITSEFQWLGNPAVESGDYSWVQIDDNTWKKAIIRENHFKFNGALSETSEVAYI